MEEGGQAYPDDSHHQDFSMFTRGFQAQPSFAKGSDLPVMGGSPGAFSVLRVPFGCSIGVVSLKCCRKNC